MNMLSYRKETSLQGALFFPNITEMELGGNILRTLNVYLQPLWYNRSENVFNSMKNPK